MKHLYAVTIDNGVFNIYLSTHAPEDGETPERYFAMLGETCPAPTPVRGWPFAEIYITHGTAENGLAVAFV